MLFGVWTGAGFPCVEYVASKTYQALYFLLCNRECKMWQCVFTSEGMSRCVPNLKNVHLIFLVLAFRFSESFTEVTCP